MCCPTSGKYGHLPKLWWNIFLHAAPSWPTTHFAVVAVTVMTISHNAMHEQCARDSDVNVPLYSNLWTQNNPKEVCKLIWNHLFWNKQNGLDVKAPLNSFSSVSIMIHLCEKLWNLNVNFTHSCANATWHFISKILALFWIKPFYIWTRRHFPHCYAFVFSSQVTFLIYDQDKVIWLCLDNFDKNYQNIMIFNMTRKCLFTINIRLEASRS